MNSSTKNNLQMSGGFLALIILMCAGMFLYARWDLKRFKESLEEQPKISLAAPPRTEKVTNTHTEESFSAETAAPKSLTQHNLEPESEGLEMETSSLETLDSLIDEFALFEVEPSEADIADVQRENLQKEEASWVDKFQEEIDNGNDLERFISNFESGKVDVIGLSGGSSEDVAIVIKTLKRGTKGPVAVDDLITMTEAWLRIQSDLPQQVQSETSITHDALTNLLSILQADKEESLQSGIEKKYPIRFE